jgi:anaerobic magnesium-protoporphyrin IX monomethyl ester cyclase
VPDQPPNRTTNDKGTGKSILLMTTAPPPNAPWYHGKKLPPLGLSYVAASLEKASFKVEMLDNYMLNKPIEEVEQLLERLNPEIVGITCGSATYRQCVETSRAVKDTLPSCKVVVGGWHASYLPDSLLQHSEIDYVVVGEGERAMVELATHITRKKSDAALATIAGVAYQRNGTFVKNAPRFINNMDEIPFPARHLLPMHLYDRTIEFLDAKPADVMSIARGCPFSCAFCETKKLWGNTCRRFSPRRVIDEINYMIGKFNTKGIYFINDNFTLKKKESAEFCDLMIKNALDIEWACDTRADLVSRELLSKMSKAGCKVIWFGVESGSPRILESINRNLTLEQIEKAVKLSKENRIKVSCSFMLGFPDETIDDLNATLKFAKKLDPDWCQFNILVAAPDSVLYEEMLRRNIYDRLDDYLLSVKTKDFDYNSLLEMQRRFLREFHRSPKRILRRVKREGPFNFINRRLKPASSQGNAGMA